MVFPLLATVFLLLLPELGTAETVFRLPGRQTDGNRSYEGHLPLSRRLAVQIPDSPAWALGFQEEDGGYRWYVESSDGFLFAVDLSEPSTPPGAPRDIEVSSLGATDAPSWAPPVVFFDETTGQPRLASLADLLLSPDTLEDVPLLLDAFPAVSSEGWTALLGKGTTSYPHGALGDLTEAGSIVVLYSGEESRVIDLGTDVAEETGVLLKDITGDGREEIITVLANSRDGARVVALGPDGSVAAEGPPIGRRFRWRHIIGSAVLSPETGTEIVAVRTPHIGGVLEIYQYRNGRLEIVSETVGFSSHRLGSPNLGQGALIDTTGDGHPEIVVPDQRQENLVILQRAPDGLREIERLALPGRLSGNLSIAPPRFPGGSPALLAGTEDGTITVWY